MLRLGALALLGASSALPAYDYSDGASSSDAELVYELRSTAEKTPHEKILDMAHVVRHHHADLGLHADDASVGEMVVRHHAAGTLQSAHVMELVTVLGTTLSPASAARASLEVTTKILDKAAGLSTSNSSDLEEGGSAGQGVCDKMAEGDMAPARSNPTEPKAATLYAPSGSPPALNGGAAMDLFTAGAGRPWTNKHMDYCFAAGVPAEVKSIVKKAIRQLSWVVPCLSFTEIGLDAGGKTQCKSLPSTYISSKVEGCWAHVGMFPKEWGFGNEMNLESPGCTSLGTTMHEILHLLGQAHEQSRPDRSDYVAVHMNKVEAKYANNFVVNNGADTGRPYDMLSLMHYGSNPFSIDGSNTIDPKPRAYSLYTNDTAEFHKYKLGNRIGMTQLDADQLGVQYGCPASTLRDAGTCVDKRGKDGKPWKDTYGQGCDVYAENWPTTCHIYSAVDYCCKCGGGIQAQTWCKADGSGCGSAKAEAKYPPAPPPSPAPKPPPPPPPPSPQEAVCLSGNVKPQASCFYWKSVGYCTSPHFPFIKSSWCQATCGGCPTDEYSNCAALAQHHGCKALLSSGKTIGSKCPYSCKGVKRAAASAAATTTEQTLPPAGGDSGGREGEQSEEGDATAKPSARKKPEEEKVDDDDVFESSLLPARLPRRMPGGAPLHPAAERLRKIPMHESGETTVTSGEDELVRAMAMVTSAEEHLKEHYYGPRLEADAAKSVRAAEAEAVLDGSPALAALREAEEAAETRISTASDEPILPRAVHAMESGASEVAHAVKRLLHITKKMKAA